MSKNTYSIKVKKVLDEQLISQWRELWDKGVNATAFNSYEWFLACLKTKKVKDFEIYICYKNSTIVALLPLQTYRCFGITVKGSICREFLVDTPFLLESYDVTVIKTFFDSIFSNKNIYLQKIDQEVSLIIHKLFPDVLFSLISVNPLFSITGDPFQNMSLSTTKRLLKIMQKNKGHLHFKSFDSNLEKHLQTIFSIQENSSKKARSLDIFASVTTKEYYTMLTKVCKKFIRINFLYVDTTPIAYEFGMQYKNSYFGSQVSFHNDYRNFVPGKLIVYYLLNYLNTINIKVADFGGGISSYKESFTSDYRVLYNAYYSTNPFILFWWKGINTVRRIKQVLFPKKYTRDHEFLFKTIDSFSNNATQQ